MTSSDEFLITQFSYDDLVPSSFSSVLRVGFQGSEEGSQSDILNNLNLSKAGVNDWQKVQFGPYKIPQAVILKTLPSFNFSSSLNITNGLGTTLTGFQCVVHLNLSNYYGGVNLASGYSRSSSLANGANTGNVSGSVVTIDDFEYQSEGDLDNAISFDVELLGTFPSGTIGKLSSGNYSYARSVNSTFTAGDFMEGSTSSITGSIYPEESNLVLSSSGSNNILVSLNIYLYK